MARFHEYKEFEEKYFFCPIHEYIWDKYLSNFIIDGQSVFYYTMEYISEHFSISAQLAFKIASDIMQEAWDLYYDRMEYERMEAECEEKPAPDPVLNNYDAWTDDDLPFC